MKTSGFYVFLFLLPFSNNTFSQNLVPNSSFEELRDLPVKRNKKNAYQYEPKTGFIPYIRNLNYWFAGTKATPDLRIKSREHLERCKKKFPDCDEPRTGDYAIGIMTFLKNTQTESFREYAQVKLKKSLKPNVTTYVELWAVKEREAKLVSNNIGCFFTEKKIFAPIQEVVSVTPHVNFDEVINKDKHGWVKLESSFVPDKSYQFISIGNFYNNENTIVVKYENSTGSQWIPPYAYYLIDDVRVWQEGDKPEKEIKKEPIVFEKKEVKPNEPIVLNNIEFAYDSDVLATSSNTELNKLIAFLNENPTLKIAIHGHTDDQGNDAYNLKLSTARAKSVFNFLQKKGIEISRLTYAGFGEQRPLTTNSTEAERSRNRRVEFLILEK